MSNNRVSPRVSRPLTATVAELAAPLPPITVAPTKATVTPCRNRSRRRATPSMVIARIAEDAARACHTGWQDIVAVAPAESTDPLLLFLRRDGQTQLMIGVPPCVVRSPRLRGEGRRRDRDAETHFELLRVAEARAEYDAAPFIVDDADEEDI